LTVIDQLLLMLMFFIGISGSMKNL